MPVVEALPKVEKDLKELCPDYGSRDVTELETWEDVFGVAQPPYSSTRLQ
jgi:hypothetical protein